MIGNKCDLEQQRQVSAEDAKSLAAEYGMEYLETSAAEEVNIDNAFRKMAKTILERSGRGSTQENGDTEIKRLLDERRRNNAGNKCCK